MSKQCTIAGDGYERNGWRVGHTTSAGGRRWHVDSPSGNRVTFDTDGGLHLALDMADAYIDGVDHLVKIDAAIESVGDATS